MKEQEPDIESHLLILEIMQSMIDRAIEKGFIDEEQIKKEWNRIIIDEIWSI